MQRTLREKTNLRNLAVYFLITLSIFFFLALQFNRDFSRVEPEFKAHYGFTLPAEIQILLFAGDRYLASNIEFITTSASSMSGSTNKLAYRSNAHKVVADLNPCHEDNMYFSNAFLSWGGQPEVGNQILEQSTACRTWDDIPPFFLGFNRFFFSRDIKGAQESLKLAIDRSDHNKVPLQQLYISIESKKFDDRNLALAFLRHELEQQNNAELKNALQIRIERLKGLIFLEKAQADFERKFKRPLSDPQELIEHGIIVSYPIDPLGIGYDFRNNAFHFSQLRLR